MRELFHTDTSHLVWRTGGGVSRVRPAFPHGVALVLDRRGSPSGIGYHGHATRFRIRAVGVFPRSVDLVIQVAHGIAGGTCLDDGAQVGYSLPVPVTPMVGPLGVILRQGERKVISEPVVTLDEVRYALKEHLRGAIGSVSWSQDAFVGSLSGVVGDLDL